MTRPLLRQSLENADEVRPESLWRRLPIAGIGEIAFRLQYGVVHQFVSNMDVVMVPGGAVDGIGPRALRCFPQNLIRGVVSGGREPVVGGWWGGGAHQRKHLPNRSPRIARVRDKQVQRL